MIDQHTVNMINQLMVIAIEHVVRIGGHQEITIVTFRPIKDPYGHAQDFKLMYAGPPQHTLNQSVVLTPGFAPEESQPT